MPVLLTIIALLVVGGGVYIYTNKKAEAPILPTSSPVDTEVQTTTDQVQSGANTKVIDTQNPPVSNTAEPCTNNGSMGSVKCKVPEINATGPKELNLNQTGTWTVNAFSPNDKGEGSTLTYSVNWGDGTAEYKFGELYPPFYHAYSKFGDFNIIITARDSTGAKTMENISVSVINSTSPGLNTTASKTVGWKTYDSGRGFSFKYPSTFSDNGNSTPQKIMFTYNDQGQRYLSITVDDLNTSLEQKAKDIVSAKQSIEQGALPLTISYKPYQIGRINGFLITTQAGDVLQNTDAIFITQILNNQTLSFSYSYQGANKLNDTYYDQIQTIISTLN